MDDEFTRVIVIGYGLVAGEVLKCVHEYAVKYGYSVEYIEHEAYPFNSALKYAQNQNLVCRMIKDKRELSDYFMSILEEKTLIVSASNNFLFPKKLCERQSITIINFHNALLPEFPGRNAPSWAIYGERKITGITWHYVTSGIDEGNIIIQKGCEIPLDVKAYELAATLMHLAADAFRECFEDVLLQKVQGIHQNVEKGRKVYKSTEIPGNGRFELTDSPKKIYRLLRALDYGKNDIFPLPTTKYEGKFVRIKRYKIVPNKTGKAAPNLIFVPYDECCLLRMTYDARYPDE